MYSELPHALALIGREPDLSEPVARSNASSQRRAGLGVWSASRAKSDRARIVGWKKSAPYDPEEAAFFATAIADVTREWCEVFTPRVFVTVPPQGASHPAPYAAAILARRVADSLGLPFFDVITRTDRKRHHGPWNALKQSPFITSGLPRGRDVAIVVDDLITSGATMRLTLQALHKEKCMAFGFAFSGC